MGIRVRDLGMEYVKLILRRLPQEGSRNGLTFKADIYFCVAWIKDCGNSVVMT